MAHSGRPTTQSDPTGSESTRSALARRGEPTDIVAVLGRLLPRLRRWAHGRLSAAAHSAVDTADVVQDALVRTLPRIGDAQLQGERALAAFLRETVSNRIHDEHRRLARRGQHTQLPESLVAPDLSPLECAIEREGEARYRAALALLPPRDRQLIVAHIELAYSPAQLGLMIGRTPNASRVALQRATRRLVDLMLHE